TTVAGAGGSWSLTLPTLADGSYTVTARATDGAGNVSLESSPISLIVDTAAPAAPVIAVPANGSFTNDSTPLVSGTAEPFATVAVSLDGTVEGTTIASGTGAWTFTLPVPASDGGHTLVATATDAAGNTNAVPHTGNFTV